MRRLDWTLIRRHPPGISLLLLVLLLASANTPASAQCAMCQGAAGAGPEGGGAYNLSTLLMLAVPYLLLLGVGGYVVYAFRRSGASSGDPASDPDPGETPGQKP